MLKLQLAVMLQNQQKSNFHQVECDKQIHYPDEILRSLIYHNIYFYTEIKKLLILDFFIMQCWKKYFHYKVSIKFDISNFSEFYQDYESAGQILFCER